MNQQIKMEKPENSSNEKLKAHSIIMIFSGIIIWLMSDSEKEMIHDLIKGLGIFLFILGIVGISDINKGMRKKKEFENLKK
jgi:Ca2+/H+ antiporter